MIKHHRRGCDTCNLETNLKPTVGQLYDLCDRLQQLSASKTEFHKAKWECTTRAEEVQQLQQALSASHLALLEERQALLQIKAENDVLRVQQLEDRHTIQRLHHGSRRCGAPACNKPACGADQHTYHNKPSTNAELRDASTVLTLKVTALEAQLHEQTSVSNQRIAALQHELQLAHTHAQQHCTLLRQQLAHAQQQLQASNTALKETITQYTTLAKAHAAAQQALDQSKAAVDGVKTQGEDALATAQRRHTQQLRRLKAAAQQQLEQTTESLRQQVQEATEQYTELHNLHVHVVGQLQHDNQALQARAVQCQRDNDNLRRRRAMDTEGFTNDIATLRKALQGLERRVRAWMLRPRHTSQNTPHNSSSYTQRQAKSANKPHSTHATKPAARSQRSAQRGQQPPHRAPATRTAGAHHLHHASAAHNDMQNSENSQDMQHNTNENMPSNAAMQHSLAHNGDGWQGAPWPVAESQELMSIQQEALLLAEAMQHLERKLQEQQDGWGDEQLDGWGDEKRDGWGDEQQQYQEGEALGVEQQGSEDGQGEGDEG